MPIETISDTALWIAAFRAQESERRDAIFHDPFARRLAGEHGEKLARALPDFLGTAQAMAVRTAALDAVILECVNAHGVDQVINLAAGLDARPYRLDLPERLRWVEVDFEALLRYKAERLAGETPRCQLESVALDLRETVDRRVLFSRLAARSERTLIVTEGLLCYLTNDQVGALAQDLHAPESFRYWTMDLFRPEVLTKVQAALSAELAGSGAKMQFAPDESTGFFKPYGWYEVRFRSALEDGQAFGREMPFSWIWSLGMFVSPPFMRERVRRMTGVALLARC